MDTSIKPILCPRKSGPTHEALPGIDGNSLRGDVLDVLTESVHLKADVYVAVSFAGGSADSSSARVPAAEPTPPAETGTILVVDDLHLNRELLSLRLGVEGHRVITAGSGREALEKLREQSIDLVLLDVMMPEMDGYEVLDRIKTDETLRHVPVIMITALDKMESVIRCIAAGAEDYLPRSADPVLLRARISACLEKKFWNDRQREHVDRVVEAMNRVERGRLDGRLEVTGDDVYAQLYRGFNLMTDGLRDAEHIMSVARDLSGELNLDALLARIMSATTELLDADRSTLFIYDRKTDELWSRVAEGVGVREIRFPAAAGLAGLAFSTGETQNVSDPYGHPAFNPEFDTRTGYRTNSILCVPIVNKAGERIGATQVLNKRNGKFTDKDEARLHAFTSQIAVSLDNAQLFDDVLNIKNYNESILKSTTNGLITLGTDRNVVTVNETACRLLRATPEALIGASAEATFTGANAWIVDSIARVEASGKEDIAVDADLVLAGGEKVSMNLVVVPLIDVTGENIGAMLIVEDITSEMRVKTTMSRYMSKEIADQLLAGGEDELGGKSQVATVLFSDIRRFTTITESLGARETVAFLNDYLSEMVDVVLRHGGILDKYIGDSVMALFGAPLGGDTDADNAVTVGCEMLVALAAMNARRQRKKIPPIRIGVGISTGTVIAGSIGSSKRMEYTVIGDSVNLAARLESANKFYGTQVLVSEHTVRQLTRDTPLREIDLIRVKGKDEPVAVFEALAFHTAKSFPQRQPMLKAYARGLTLYRRRDWRGAMNHFARALAMRPSDGPSRIHLQRCGEYLESPPPESWSGVWAMAEK